MKVYDPATDAWATLGSMPSTQGEFALAVLDGRLFAAGGNLADNTAIGTLSANRPPETTWWSHNRAVGQITPATTATSTALPSAPRRSARAS